MNEHDPEKLRKRLGRRLCAFWQGEQGLLLSVSGYFSQEAKQGVLPAHAHGARGALHVGDLSRFFPLFEQIFLAEALHPILDYKMQDFRIFVHQNCILILDAEQDYLKLQATDFKNKEVTANLTLEQIGFSKTPYSKPYTLNAKFILNHKP